MSRPLPALTEAKAQARRLRDTLSKQGTAISHAQALELLARQFGLRDWNTLHAAIGNRAPDGFLPGGRVRGRYLSKPFTATVRAVERLQPGWYRLVLDLDEAVDVVASARFSNYRKRLRGVVGPDGHSRERTSDGRPHLELEL